MERGGRGGGVTSEDGVFSPEVNGTLLVLVINHGRNINIDIATKQDRKEHNTTRTLRNIRFGARINTYA